MTCREWNILFYRDAFQVLDSNALIEWARRAREHLVHYPTLATGKNETGIVALLYSGTKECLHVLRAIVANLLKFIDGHDTRFLGLVKVLEDFIQRGLHGLDVA